MAVTWTVRARVIDAAKRRIRLTVIFQEGGMVAEYTVAGTLQEGKHRAKSLKRLVRKVFKQHQQLKPQRDAEATLLEGVASEAIDKLDELELEAPRL